VLALDVPAQEIYDPLPLAFDHDGYVIQPLARFSLVARMLSRSNYHLDRMSSLIPTDLVLGCGAMSDTSVLRLLSIEQSARFYSGRLPNFRFRDGKSKRIAPTCT